jgi:Tfp pilus assembly protein FimV
MRTRMLATLAAPVAALSLSASAPGPAAVPRHTVQAGAADLVLAKTTARPPATTDHSPARYRVRSGDTLMSIAHQVYGHSTRWPALWFANRRHVRNPDALRVGQVLALGWHPAKGWVRPWLTARAMAAIPQPPPPQVRHVTTVTAPAPVAAPVSYSGSSSMQQCIIAAESAGNSQVMNSSGHYGLYQFSEQTWVANGGSAADFGNASVAEQNRVFANTVASSGYSAWTPYDSC